MGTAFQNQDASWNLRFAYLPADRTPTVQMRPVRSVEEVVERVASATSPKSAR
jgi:hypothetical protein